MDLPGNPSLPASMAVLMVSTKVVTPKRILNDGIFFRCIALDMTIPVGVGENQINSYKTFIKTIFLYMFMPVCIVLYVILAIIYTLFVQ